MKIMITGGDGQLGRELSRELAPVGQVYALARTALDVTDAQSVRLAMRKVEPDVIVNAAAYTNVDKAESEPDAAMAVNHRAAYLLAQNAKAVGALLLHFSTDYIFDGKKSSSYSEVDNPSPLNQYGASKLAGEEAIVASGCEHIILRTSWLYASHSRNFLLTMLRLADRGQPLQIVDDQIGAPTWARDVAHAARLVIEGCNPPQGVYHLTAAGKTTWFGFAAEIFRLAKLQPAMVAVSSEHYSAAALRPRNSLLNTNKFCLAFGMELPAWQESLSKCMTEMGLCD